MDLATVAVPEDVGRGASEERLSSLLGALGFVGEKNHASAGAHDRLHVVTEWFKSDSLHVNPCDHQVALILLAHLGRVPAELLKRLQQRRPGRNGGDCRRLACSAKHHPSGQQHAEGRL